VGIYIAGTVPNSCNFRRGAVDIQDVDFYDANDTLIRVDMFPWGGTYSSYSSYRRPLSSYTSTQRYVPAEYSLPGGGGSYPYAGSSLETFEDFRRRYHESRLEWVQDRVVMGPNGPIFQPAHQQLVLLYQRYPALPFDLSGASWPHIRQGCLEIRSH
jgi:hypothetical protein